MDEDRSATEHNDAAELLELEHTGWQALCTGDARGAEHYAAAMADGAVMVLANGAVMTRDDVVDALREAPPWDTYSIESPRVVTITADVRALVYSAVGHRGGTEFRGAMSSVYVRTPAGWRLALHQQTSTGNGA